jgi:hypothetical protein
MWTTRAGRRNGFDDGSSCVDGICGYDFEQRRHAERVHGTEPPARVAAIQTTRSV